jgi:hypothetical protein
MDAEPGTAVTLARGLFILLVPATTELRAGVLTSGEGLALGAGAGAGTGAGAGAGEAVEGTGAVAVEAGG